MNASVEQTPVKRSSRWGWIVLPILSLLFALSCLLARPWPLGWLDAGGTLTVSVVAAVLIRYFSDHIRVEGTTARQTERILSAVSLLGLIGVEVVLLTIGNAPATDIGFLLIAPLTAQAMLVSALLGTNSAVFSLTIVAFLIGVTGPVPKEILATAWISGTIASHAVNPMRQRADLIRAVSVTAVAQAIIAACATLMISTSAAPVLQSGIWAALSAVISTAIFWLGITILERVFGQTSDWSLLELCSPEHPLIRELCLRAPGTYAHSVMVANLAEQAARAIGANPIHLRAMAYFHDIGKIERPAFFIENQLAENLHDELPPTMSARIITAHVRDGLELGSRHRLPALVMDGIAQHHGTSLVSYFYHRACNMSGDEIPLGLDRLFRYDGPKPQNRETAILHLADQVEAASRTRKAGSVEELENMIEAILESSRSDGQLDECDLTFRDMTALRNSFLHTLAAVRHARITYPTPDLTHEPLSDTDSERDPLANPTRLHP